MRVNNTEHVSKNTCIPVHIALLLIGMYRSRKTNIKHRAFINSVIENKALDIWSATLHYNNKKLN